MKQIFQSSQQALDKPRRGIREAKYPWKNITAGQSFSVNHSEIKLNSLRPLVSRMAKKFNKKFRVIDHGEEAGYEVACIHMTEVEAIQSSSNVVEASRMLGDGATGITQSALDDMNVRFPVRKEE